MPSSSPQAASFITARTHRRSRVSRFCCFGSLWLWCIVLLLASCARVTSCARDDVVSLSISLSFTFTITLLLHYYYALPRHVPRHVPRHYLIEHYYISSIFSALFVHLVLLCDNMPSLKKPDIAQRVSNHLSSTRTADYPLALSNRQRLLLSLTLRVLSHCLATFLRFVYVHRIPLCPLRRRMLFHLPPKQATKATREQ